GAATRSGSRARRPSLGGRVDDGFDHAELAFDFPAIVDGEKRWRLIESQGRAQPAERFATRLAWSLAGNAQHLFERAIGERAAGHHPAQAANELEFFGRRRSEPARRGARRAPG